ncbi:MAG: DNA glycosylase [Armatimonadota bacterium]
MLGYEAFDLYGQPLNLDLTFSCGQAFRWRKLQNGFWRGVVRDKLVELATQNGLLVWRTFPEKCEDLVRNYLRLDDDVNAIYSQLASSDRRLADLIGRFYGLRLLKQDPEEALISFVCSVVSNIPRISATIEAVASQFGDLVCERDGLCYYAFPSIKRLAQMEHRDLSSIKSMGFRSRSVASVARQVVERGEDWLNSLAGLSYEEARYSLMSIVGVGRKIADCTCLFALGKDEAVPVDTHVRQIARRLWGLGLNTSSLTKGLYECIACAFRERYGMWAGWAQQFLFYEDLLRTKDSR